MAALVHQVRRRVPDLRRRGINAWAKARAKMLYPRVTTRVSPREDMLDQGTLHIYFEVGASAMEQIRAGLRDAGAGPPRRVLDLPSGFGRVMRHMKAEWPDAQFTAMELQHEGARFCAATFGARPVFSADPLWSVDAGDGYDLLWSGSLLTHFDSDRWHPVLTYFRDRVAPGGTVIFTTHGDRSIGLLAGEPEAVAVLAPLVGDYGMGLQAADLARMAQQTGFAFAQYGDADFPWGCSVSAPDWVRDQVAGVGGLEFVRHVPAGWFQHQDVWTYKRTAE